MTTAKKTTLTLKASELRALLGDVLPFVDNDKFTLPILACIHLDGHGDHVTAVATDRYCIGVRKVHVEAPKTLSANLDFTVVRQMLTTFKRTRNDDPVLTLNFSKTSVTVESNGGLDGLILDTRMSFSLYDGQYPKISTLFDAISSPATADSASPTIRADFLARFKHLDRVTLHLAATKEAGKTAPVFVRATDFIGAVMPQAITGGASDKFTTRDLSEWKSFMDAKPAAKTARKGAAA